MKNNHSTLTVFAAAISVFALLIASVSLSKAGKARLEDDDFMAKVEKGIEDYIEKQRQAQAGGQEAPSGPVEVSIDDDAIKGDKNAPVTIVEFSDYECPFCGRFYQNTLTEIVSEYIDTGKVRLVYRDFPLSFHRNARGAAMAAECAKEQGGDKAYYKMHDVMYENNTALTVENLKKWAGEQGLDTAKFNSCFDSEKFAGEIDKDFADGQSYGVSGTPAFFINGRKLSGAQPFSVFKSMIEEELAK
jgi:protein-disulfide isomerase